MAEPIYRTVFEVEVFSRGPLHLAGDDVLAEVNYAITEGDCIGDVHQKAGEVVPPGSVEAAMIRIGNDGTFFDDVYDVELADNDDLAHYTPPESP